MKKDEVKPLKLDEWRKRGKKLKPLYNSYDDLRKDCLKVFKKKEYFGLYEHTEKNLMAILPHKVVEYVDDERVHMCRDSVLFNIVETGYEKIDMEKMINKMVPILAKKMDEKAVKDLMKDVLEDIDPPDLLEFYNRTVELKGKVRPAPGCFKFKIGGKPGAPKELMIRQ